MDGLAIMSDIPTTAELVGETLVALGALVGAGSFISGLLSFFTPLPM